MTNDFKQAQYKNVAMQPVPAGLRRRFLRARLCLWCQTGGVCLLQTYGGLREVCLTIAGKHLKVISSTFLWFTAHLTLSGLCRHTALTVKGRAAAVTRSSFICLLNLYKTSHVCSRVFLWGWFQYLPITTIPHFYINTQLEGKRKPEWSCVHKQKHFVSVCSSK